MAYTLRSTNHHRRRRLCRRAWHPAEVETVGWSASGADTVTLAVDPENFKRCSITSLGELGSVQVAANADADLGAGVRWVA